MFDDIAQSEIKEDPNQVIHWVLLGSYGYFIGKPILTDKTYDEFSDKLKKEWDSLDHSWKTCIHKDFVSLEKASTLVVSPPYPYEIAKEANHLIRQIYGEY